VSKKWITGLPILIALAMLGVGWMAVTSAARLTERQLQETQPAGQQPSERERDAELNVPAISFIDSPSPTCYRIEQGTDICAIEWQYLSVDASPNYMISMTVDIDGEKRAYVQGFFQNSFYVPGDMFSPSFLVACGIPDVGGSPGLGFVHAYTLRARDSSGLSAANYGSVACPPDLIPLADVALTGPANGDTDVAITFYAAVTPVTATLPVTYTWSVTDQPAVTVTGAITDTQTYLWDTPGEKMILVQAQNLANSVMQTTTIKINLPPTALPPPPTLTPTSTPQAPQEFWVYLPLVRR